MSYESESNPMCIQISCISCKMIFFFFLPVCVYTHIYIINRVLKILDLFNVYIYMAISIYTYCTVVILDAYIIKSHFHYMNLS